MYEERSSLRVLYGSALNTKSALKSPSASANFKGLVSIKLSIEVETQSLSIRMGFLGFRLGLPSFGREPSIAWSVGKR